MKVLIVNQPIGNRGDESAHRALMNALERDQNFDVEVLFVGSEDKISEEILNCFAGNHYSREKYLRYEADGIFARLPYRSFFMPASISRLLEILSPTARKVLSKMKDADLILCAPGGVCMGPYRTWGHIWILSAALRLEKKVAIYSRSVGPFLGESKKDKVFKKVSTDILERSIFLSLRDSKSQEYGRDMGIDFIESIDTAFLDHSQKEIPVEYGFLKNEKYAVFVPNELNTWHFDFKEISGNSFELFYKKIMENLIEHGLHIVMLPQKCKPAFRPDYSYFQKLSLEHRQHVTVVPDKYDSEVQQAIIKHSSLVVGARYHSIVFAVNNSVPFVSLSYENKMSGMLELLGLSDMCYILKDNGIESSEKVTTLIDGILENRTDYVERVKVASEKAKKIANNCFEEFLNTLHRTQGLG